MRRDIEEIVLADVISLVPALEVISIGEGDDVLYEGFCQDFKATYVGAYDLLNRKVNKMCASKGVLKVFLGRD